MTEFRTKKNGKKYPISSKKPKYKCDICGKSLTYEQEFHGKCPRCGAPPFERIATRKTKQRYDTEKQLGIR